MDKVITAVFQEGGSNTVTVYGLWQWDHGISLQIMGLSLPETVEVHFALTNGEPVKQEGHSSDGITTVNIPDSMLAGPTGSGTFCGTQAFLVNAWVYVEDGESGRTVKMVRLNVKTRAKPPDYIATPDEKKTWEQLQEGKADRLEVAGSILSLMSGERLLSEVTLPTGGGGEELADIRVGADGKIYASAGEAVRVQVGELNKDLGELRTVEKGYNLFDESNVTENTRWYTDFSGTTTSEDLFLTDYIPVVSGKYLFTTYLMSTGARVRGAISKVLCFNSDKEKMVDVSMTSLASYFVIPDGVSFVRMEIHYLTGGNDSRNEMMILLEDTVENFGRIPYQEYGYKKVSINEDVEIKTDDTLSLDKPANAKAVGDAIKKIVLSGDIPYANAMIVGVGDSIMIGGENQGGFLAKLKEKYPNMTVANYGVGSTTIGVNDDIEVNRLYKCIYDRIDTISEEPDYIILEGGLNDYFHGIPLGEIADGYPISANYNTSNGEWNYLTVKGGADITTQLLDTSTFSGAFEASLIKIMTKWWNKKYGFIITHTPLGNSDIDVYLDRAKEICKKYEFPCLDMRECSGMIGSIVSIRNKYMLDTAHPSADGYRLRYLPPIEAWLKTL